MRSSRQLYRNAFFEATISIQSHSRNILLTLPKSSHQQAELVLLPSPFNHVFFPQTNGDVAQDNAKPLPRDQDPLYQSESLHRRVREILEAHEEELRTPRQAPTRSQHPTTATVQIQHERAPT